MTEQVVNVTECCRGVELGATGDVQRQAGQSGLGRRPIHVEETDDECVGLPLKQGVFPKQNHQTARVTELIASDGT